MNKSSHRHRLPRLGRVRVPGTGPGVLSFDPEAPAPTIRLIAYGPNGIVECDFEDVGQLASMREDWAVVWIDVIGFGQGHELEALRSELGLHVLAIEDTVNLGQRAKVERYENELFIIGRMTAKPPRLTEQVSLFLGNGWLMTVQERAGDPFEPVRKRIRQQSGRARARGADYLLYALLDMVVDSYFPVLDTVGDELDDLEEVVLAAPNHDAAVEIHSVRRKLVGLRKALGPHREALNTLLRDENDLVAEETQLYLRDVYDHALRSAELADAYRDLATDLMSMHMSAISNRMNEVMKVLTIIASIFIPLGFIAGLYGMNFDPSVSDWNMPELGWRYGYAFALGLMVVVAGGFIFFMQRKGWLK